MIVQLPALIRVFLDAWLVFFIAMWVIFPAYLANAVAVPLARRIHFRPIDRGTFFLGQRVLGDGKTVGGFLLASVVGIAGGLVQQLVAGPVAFYLANEWTLVYHPLLVPSWHLSTYVAPSVGGVLRALLLPPGAMAGDLLGSFIKRRLGIPRGRSAPVLDQVDFLAGAFLLSLVLLPVQESLLDIDPWYILLIIIITPPIHLAVNKIAYKLRLKDVAS